MSDYDYEKEEFERVAKYYKISPTILEQKYPLSKIQILKPSVWKTIKNTTSWNVKNIEEVADISNRSNKNYKKIAIDMIDTKKTYAPIILKNKEKYHLIAGNVRLMLCRVLNIQPQVCIVEI